MTIGTHEPLAQGAGRFDERPAPAELAGHFTRVWRHANPTARELRFAVVPDGRMDLIFINGALRIAGPDAAAIVESIAPGEEAFGLSFAPGAATGFLGVAAHELTGRRIRLEELFGPGVAGIAERIGEARSSGQAQSLFLDTVGGFAASRPPGDAQALAIWRELFGVRGPAGAGLRQVAARLCLSERTLRRRSLDLFGHAPARLGAIARLQRFLAAVRAHPSEGLAELAFSAGYADQSHLSRECRRFIGLSPGAVKRQFAPMLADPFKTGAVIGG